MNVLSDNQRRSERQQTFYAAYAYTCRDGDWCRLDVKIFDQSGQGVRLRSMQNLEGEKLYLQLDPTSPVLVNCTVRRSQPVARNCWEFGLELDELAEMREVLPREVLDAYGITKTAVSSQQNQLMEDAAVRAAVPTQAEAPVVPALPVPGMTTASSSHPDQLTEDIVIEAGASETTPDVDVMAPALPVADMAADSATPASQPNQQPSEDVAVAANVPESPEAAAPEVSALPMPSMVKKKPGFLKTVMVGFSGLANVVGEFAIKVAKSLRFVIGANVPPGSFFSNKSEEAQRLEWLQACSRNVGIDRTEGLNWTENPAASQE